MAQSGKIYHSKEFLGVKSVSEKMKDEVKKLKKDLKNATPKEKIKIQKRIDAKEAGIKSTSLSLKRKLTTHLSATRDAKTRYNNPIPTLQGTKKDIASKKAAAKRKSKKEAEARVKRRVTRAKIKKKKK